LNEWDNLSEWWDKKQGDEGDLWHRAIIDPMTMKLVGNVAGKDVLDLGCGNGYLSRRLARQGARIVAIDSSPGMIRMAEARDPEHALSIDYRVTEASDLSSMGDSSFDVVVANMSIMDIPDAEAAIIEVGRVLRAGGRLVASVCHPCFDTGTGSSWLVDRTLTSTDVFRKVRGYRAISSFLVPWNPKPGEMAWTNGYQRPLSWYARSLKGAGLLISALEEPVPLQEAVDKDPQGEWLKDVPLHLVIEAVKQPRANA
jgi:SAM-dependent methyltransferase